MTKLSFNGDGSKVKRLILILLLLNLVFIWGNSLLNPNITHSISDVIVDMFSEVKEDGGKLVSSGPLPEEIYTRPDVTPELVEKYPDVFNTSETKWEYRRLVRKSAHILEYLCFGLLCGMYFFFDFSKVGADKLLRLTITGFVVPVTDEIIQRFCDRSANFQDVLIDFCGYAIGVGAAILILYLVRKKKVKSLLKE